MMRVTPQVYYRLERESPDKHDWLDGVMYPSPTCGGTDRHSLIIVNVLARLHQGLRGRSYRAYESSLRLCVKATGLRTYPDAAAYCDELEFDEEDELGETPVNPTVLFEVLAKNVEGYERGIKAVHYRRIESLREYVLISQDAAHAEACERTARGSWSLRDVRGLDETLVLNSIGLRIPMAEIYDGVEFPKLMPALPTAD